MSWVWLCTASNKNVTINTQICLTIIQRGMLKSGS
jgi:hypothetical protein